MLGRWNELDSAVSRPVLRVTSGVPEVALGSVMAVVIGPWKGRGGGGGDQGSISTVLFLVRLCISYAAFMCSMHHAVRVVPKRHEYGGYAVSICAPTEWLIYTDDAEVGESQLCTRILLSGFGLTLN